MPKEYFKKPGKQKSGGLNYGKSTGLFTRGGFPDHSDVKPGPLNSGLKYAKTLSTGSLGNISTAIGGSGTVGNTKEKIQLEKMPKQGIEPVKIKKSNPIEITKDDPEVKTLTGKETISLNKQEYKDLKAEQKEERKMLKSQIKEGEKTKKDKKTLKSIQKDERKQLKKTHRDEKVDALNVDREASGEKKDPRHYKSDKKTRFGRWADKMQQWRSDEESSHGDFQKVMDNAQQFVQTMSGGKVTAPKSFEQKQMERKSFAEDLKRKQLLNEQRNVNLAKMKENTTDPSSSFAVDNAGDINLDESTIAPTAEQTDLNQEQKTQQEEFDKKYGYFDPETKAYTPPKT